jgi:S-formylglutathione hydrolase FrmB
MIVVMPDVLTRFKGAMFSASPTTGDFERYVAQDLVGYIDGHYRTIADVKSRGLSGHSMGGYGTLKIAEKYPGIFSSIYAMAPCCLSPGSVTAEQLQTVAGLTDAKIAAATGFDLAAPAQLSAWAPDPKNPPYYVSTAVKDGKVDPLLLARLHANSPLVMLPQYVPALKALEAIRVEVGDKDFLIGDDTLMHEELDRFGVAHEWKVFEGDHGNRVHDRIRSELLPFFGAHLDK